MSVRPLDALAPTVVVPTYNRPRFLERSLVHFNRDESPLRILIADGSTDETKLENEALIRELGRDLDLHHLTYSPELGMISRLADVLRQLDAPYVAMHADDDFMLWRGLTAVATHLEARPELVAAQGMVLLGRRQDGLVRVMPYLYQDVLQDTPLERLAWHMRSYRPTFYSVHRTSRVARAFAEISPHEGWWPRMVEIGLSSLIAVQGRFAHVPVLQGIREAHVQAESQKDIKWPAIVVHPDYSTVLDDYTRTVTAVVLERADEPRAQEADAEATVGRAVREAFLEFLKGALVPAHLPRVPSLIKQSWAVHDLFADQRRLRPHMTKIRDVLGSFV